ncbi:MAG: radical SAM protein [Nanoarchaeota archaeon]|nr:radical SAM protein [Nanoarchaeota archaeon]
MNSLNRKEMFKEYPCQMDICFSERCVMNCDYCFVDKSNFALLDLPTIKKAVDLFFSFPIDFHTITLTTTESLTYPELTKGTLRYIFDEADSKNVKVKVILTTNGIFLNKSMRDFLESLDNRFQLNISWDGRPSSHDAHRKMRGDYNDKTIKSSNIAFKKFFSLEDKNRPRVIFTVTPSEVKNLVENIDFIIDHGFKKIDIFPQMLQIWGDKDLRKLEEIMKKVINKINSLEGYDLRLLNRLWGTSHYNKLLLGSDGKFYLFEMVLVVNHKERQHYLIGDPYKGIDFKKRIKMFEELFSFAEISGEGRCNNCSATPLCFVPLPLLIWCKTKEEDFKKYLDNFCKIARIFVKLAESTNDNIKNELDRKKLSKKKRMDFNIKNSNNKIPTQSQFFSKYLNAVPVSEKSHENAIELLNILTHFDPYNLTKFEFSFKVKDGEINKDVRFLNIDADAYSCRNSKFFLKRVQLFEKILERKCINKDFKKVVSALKRMSNTPMDLYFGADIQDESYLFGFWLIFGGVKPGKISFWPYNFDRIIDSSLRAIGLKKHKLLKKEILNLGFDIGKDSLRYKVYYLCREKVLQNHTFTGLMKEINENLDDFKYFYFFSEMYDEEGRLVKEKLFVEFLEDVKNDDEKAIKKILERLLKIKGLNFNLKELNSALFKCGGRISLISFEQDKTLTFYIRLD